MSNAGASMYASRPSEDAGASRSRAFVSVALVDRVVTKCVENSRSARCDESIWTTTDFARAPHAGLLTNERRRRGIPLALQGAIVMAFGLSIAYLMYKLTTEDDDELKVVHARETSDFP